MAKGSYNITVPGDSNPKEDRKKSKEAEKQEWMDSCPAFLRSLSFHDRRRSSRVRAEKELLKSQYKALVSTSLEKIPSNPSPSSEARCELSMYHDFESFRIHGETWPIYNASLPSADQETVQNRPFDPDSWNEDRHSTSSVESEKLLKKTIAILRTVDKDISESLASLTKPESIALESVMEVYKNKDKSTADGSADPDLDLPTDSFNSSIYENWQSPIQQRLSAESCEPIYENWQPSMQQTSKKVQSHSTPLRPNTLQAQSSLQSSQKVQAQSSLQSSQKVQAQSSLKSPQSLHPHFAQESPKNLLSHSSEHSQQNLQAHSSKKSPENVQDHSTNKSQKNIQAPQRPKTLQTLQTQSPQPSLSNVQAQSRKNPKNLQLHSAKKTQNSQAHSSQQSPELLVHSTDKTLKNYQSLLDQMITPDSDKVRSVETSPRNFQSPPKTSGPDDTTEVKSPFHFYLPSDHEQFLKIIGALQNRCLEYREMIQDIAVSALDECLNFSELSIKRILYLRIQFASQKKNFRDFKELCSKSVVFGPDSQPMDQKVTELIQSFYLKLQQEENETFMVRVEFGLKMGEMYAKMLELETESKKTILALEKEILYLKKTSVGFRV